MHDRSRRAIIGPAGAALTVGLAGCNDILGDDGGPADAGAGSPKGGGGTPVESGDESGPGGYATVERWLEGGGDGGAADNYDGTFEDWRGRDAVTVDVDAAGNDGHAAFAPSAAVVSTGTEVRWEWTGEDASHNVVSAPAAQLGASDYEFRSGDPERGGDVTFTRTLDRAGYLLYHCEPHLSAGMKGGLGVE